MRVPQLRVAVLVFLASAAGCQQQAPALPAAAATAMQPPGASPTEVTSGQSASDSGLVAINWEQLDIGIDAESRFEPWMMKTAIQSLEGEHVRITGYMHAGVAVREGIREFVLLRNIDCPYGRQGEAHHVIVVKLGGAERTSYSPQAMTIEGIFHVRPFDGPDGSTWSLYALDEARVSASNGELSPAPESIHKQEGENAP